MISSVLSKIKFVDLYIGEEYCDIKGLEGSSDSRASAPLHLKDAIADLRKHCKEVYAEQEEPEFSVVVDDVLFRVTAMTDVMNKDVFILRRSTAEIRSLDKIGLNPVLARFALDPQTRGTILCVGDMAAGKTSTIASMYKERLERLGGIGLCIEDPNETPLNGEFGKGRSIQVRASRKNGGYREQLIRAVRSGADQILIGEIRDEPTAFEVAQSGINGHIIFTTMHAGDVVQGVERFATKCAVMTEKANALIAEGLSAVFWQGFERVPRQGGNGYSNRLVSKMLILTGNEGQGARAKIREGKFHLLVQEIDEQNRRSFWQQNNGARG